MSHTLVILGAAGGARLANWHLQEAYPGAKAAFVCDDVKGVTDVEIGGTVVPVISDWDFSRLREQHGDPESFRQFIVGTGFPKVKKILVRKALAHGLEPAPTLVHPKSFGMGLDSSVGKGGMFSPGSTVATNTALGDYVVLGPNTAIGHDCTIGDYVSCNLGGLVAGNVVLGEGVIVGAGAVVNERLRIAPGVVIGAQACVVRDVLEPDVTMDGVPAKKVSPPA